VKITADGRVVMSSTEWFVSIGLITPLVLGILAFIEKWAERRRKRGEPKEEQPIVQGMTVSVDYAAELVTQLKADLVETQKERDKALAEIEAYKAIHRSKND
jgi:hypothetical protein